MQVNPVAFVAPAMVFMVAIFVWSFRLVRRLPAEPTPDACWRLGMVYYNPDDPAVFAQCTDCGQAYWRGAHYARLQAIVDESLRVFGSAAARG